MKHGIGLRTGFVEARTLAPERAGPENVMSGEDVSSILGETAPTKVRIGLEGRAKAVSVTYAQT